MLKISNIFTFKQKYTKLISLRASSSLIMDLDSKRNIKEKHPLKGIRILDLTRIVAGPYCTMLLADLGAEVIKIEKPLFGDESRKWGPPFLENSKDSVYFMAVNRNKKSICINLKAGTQLIYDLAKKSDILVENYIPGKLSKYKLGFEDVKQIAPHLIYCSITGYGSTGPYAEKPGYDVIAASIGGLLHITGSENGPPAKCGVAMTDIATGLYAHGAILAALLQRQKTGLGQKIDVNLLSTQIACLINVGSNYLNAGKEAKRWGTAHESIVPYETFKTATEYLTLGAGSDEQFKALCKFLSLENLIENLKFKTNQDRVKNRKELNKILSDIFIKESSDYWMKIFDSAPFPVGPVNNMQKVFSDKHVKEIAIVKTLPHPAAGSVKVVGPSVVYSDAENDARTGPPLLGQHTDDILTNLLEYKKNEIEILRLKKIIQ